MKKRYTADGPFYRAYHKQEKKMYLVQRLDFASGGTNVTIGEGEQSLGIYSLNEIILLQWTGHFDVSGVKIFHGDIVNCKRPNATMHIVVWDKKRCSFYLQPIDGLGHARYDKGYRMNGGVLKVIGNVYEHRTFLAEYTAEPDLILRQYFTD